MIIMNKIIQELRKELKQNSEEKIKESSKRFFKEEIKVYGIKSAIVGQIAKTYYYRNKKSK